MNRQILFPDEKDRSIFNDAKHITRQIPVMYYMHINENTAAPKTNNYFQNSIANAINILF